MKKYIILICTLVLCMGINAYAQNEKGAAMPGGKFTLGEFNGDNARVYNNAWAGLSFTAPDYYEDKSYISRLDIKLSFIIDGDEKQAQKLAAQDFDSAMAFSYSADGKGSVGLAVYRVGHKVLARGSIPEIEVLQGLDDFFDKLTEKYLGADYEGRGKVNGPYAAVLGERAFTACDIIIGGVAWRYYAQQIDDFLVVVDMMVYKEMDRGWLFKEFEDGFAKYK